MFIEHRCIGSKRACGETSIHHDQLPSIWAYRAIKACVLLVHQHSHVAHIIVCHQLAVRLESQNVLERGRTGNIPRSYLFVCVARRAGTRPVVAATGKFWDDSILNNESTPSFLAAISSSASSSLSSVAASPGQQCAVVPQRQQLL